MSSYEKRKINFIVALEILPDGIHQNVTFTFKGKRRRGLEFGIGDVGFFKIPFIF